MKLNTVMIKISEVERSRRTYELNIVHIKDESQESHKQIDTLRRNLAHQENLLKKIIRFRNYVLQQRDYALNGCKDFQQELEDWRNFLREQYKHLQQLGKSQHFNNEDDSDNPTHKIDTPFKPDQKAMQRNHKLEELIKLNDDELSKIALQLQLATGISDAGKIIQKFFINKEINTEQRKVLDKLQVEKKSKLKEQTTLEEELKKQISTNQTDLSWREIDVAQQQLDEAVSILNQEKLQAKKIACQMTGLNEWFIVLCVNLNQHLVCNIIWKTKKITKKHDLTDELLDCLLQHTTIFQSILQSVRAKENTFKKKNPGTTKTIEKENNMSSGNKVDASKMHKHYMQQMQKKHRSTRKFK
ncbi:cingulin [Reticulomyxa filosa]|uniref:Cingulin n=1 Tax=Reticulomyxa filosa TaxID=46433 RepID=X6PED0_RETFI|nr:cingulin [Reticulomyxa filosa]|eukprot:ETO36581.1 cingulin [Reticulomyxa filosa]